jgi:hypothetical protein
MAAIRDFDELYYLLQEEVDDIGARRNDEGPADTEGLEARARQVKLRLQSLTWRVARRLLAAKLDPQPLLRISSYVEAWHRSWSSQSLPQQEELESIMSLAMLHMHAGVELFRAEITAKAEGAQPAAAAGDQGLPTKRDNLADTTADTRKKNISGTKKEKRVLGPDDPGFLIRFDNYMRKHGGEAGEIVAARDFVLEKTSIEGRRAEAKAYSLLRQRRRWRDWLAERRA